METVLLLFLFAASNIACFWLGAKVRQKVDKGEPVEMPKIDPISYIQEQKDKRIAREERREIDAIMRNVDAYDGTSNGQIDVPRGK